MSFRLKLLVIVSLLVLAAGGISAWLLSREAETTLAVAAEVSVTEQRAALHRAEQDRALVLARYVARASAGALFDQRLGELNQIVNEATKFEGVVQVSILNPMGQVVADGAKGTFLHRKMREDTTARRAVSSEEGGSLLLDGTLYAWAPVRLSTERIGTVLAELSMERSARRVAVVRSKHAERVATARATIRGRFALIGVVTFLVTVALSFVVAARLTKRVTQLSQVAEQIAAGDRSLRGAVSGGDEIASLGRAFDHMLDEIETYQTRLAEQQRLQQELKIAETIQLALLPKVTQVGGLQVAAAMHTATEVGGDYYDLIATEGGEWICIGDVTGHGLTAGLIMLMVQTGIATLARSDEGDHSPAEVLTHVNRALADNVRSRLEADDHMTLTVMRHLGGGRFRYAGAHEDLVIWRRASGTCEVLPTSGPWVGIKPEIGEIVTESELTLAPGDRLILYTDGITEARTPAGEMYEIQRLCEAIQNAEDSVDGVVASIFASVDEFTSLRHDDQTVVVIEMADMGDQPGEP